MDDKENYDSNKMLKAYNEKLNNVDESLNKSIEEALKLIGAEENSIFL